MAKALQVRVSSFWYRVLLLAGARAVPAEDRLSGPTFDARIAVVDVALPWLRTDHRGLPLPETDWRFHAIFGDGTEVTFNFGATARDVAEYLQGEGIPIRTEDDQ